MKSIYRLFVDETGKLVVSLVSVQKQYGGYNCGLFAIAFADVTIGRSSEDAYFDVNNMRHHLLYCLENKTLIPFPKVDKRTDSREIIKLFI